MVKNDEVKTEFEMFADIWKFFKEVLPVGKMSDEYYWNRVLELAKIINQKYQSQLSIDVVNAVVDELERRGRKNDENTNTGC